MSSNPIGETSGDKWDDFAKVYKAMTYDTSLKPQVVLLEKVNSMLPFSDATGILDNGCGPGPVMTRILDSYKVPESCTLTCSDFSEGMVNEVKKHKEEVTKADPSSPWSRMETVVQDAMDMKSIADGTQSHVTAGFAYFIPKEPMKALTETYRMLKDGGVIGLTSWRGTQWLDVMNVLTKIRPEKVVPSMPQDWTDAAKLEALVEAAGFKDVEVLEVTTRMPYEKRVPLVEVLGTKLPLMAPLLKDMSKEEVQSYIDLMDETAKKFCPDEPGSLEGWAIVVVGRK